MNIILKEAKREGFIKEQPVLEPFGNKRQKHRQPLTDREMMLLFPEDRAEFLEVWDEFEMGVMFQTLLSTGARSGEARGWWKSDIMIEAKAIKIFRQMYLNGTYGLPGRQRNPDKDPRRIALLPDRTLKDIIELIGLPPYPDEPLFTFEGRPVARPYLLRRLKRAVEKAGISNDIDVHTLRYTYTSKMRELMITADVPDSILQKMLGHKNSTVTDIYDPFLFDREVKKLVSSRPAIDNFWNNSEESE
jgi:integrase